MVTIFYADPKDKPEREMTELNVKALLHETEDKGEKDLNETNENADDTKLNGNKNLKEKDADEENEG